VGATHGAVGRDDLEEPTIEAIHDDDLAKHFDAQPCPTGTEMYEKLSIKELREQYIGVASLDEVPGLNKMMPRDPLLDRDPWLNEEFFKDSNNVQPLRLDPLQWHGIAACISNAFDGLPTTVTDEVGAGKTFLVLGIINEIMRFRVAHKETGTFPASAFRESRVN
jgi:hypothetical protein